MVLNRPPITPTSPDRSSTQPRSLPLMVSWLASLLVGVLGGVVAGVLGGVSWRSNPLHPNPWHPNPWKSTTWYGFRTNFVFYRPQQNENFITQAVRQAEPAVVRLDLPPQTERVDRTDQTKPNNQADRPTPDRPTRKQPGTPSGTPSPPDRANPSPTTQSDDQANSSSVNDLPIRPSRTGTGVVIREDGYILTNAHVVGQRPAVKVSLADGREFVGETIGIDAETDVAVLKIAARDLPVMLVNPEQVMRPGEWAIAIGHPLGLEQTITAGIISGTQRSSRDLGILGQQVEFIQTDAAMNPGNSGGPLLNAAGEMVALNTAIELDGTQGLGFAIPIKIGLGIAEQLMRQGKVERSYLGVQLVTLTPDLAQQAPQRFKLSAASVPRHGVLIVRVLPNSPAAQVGLLAGDVIQAIDNQPIRHADQVKNAVRSAGIGAWLDLDLVRETEQFTLAVQLSEAPTPTPSADR